MGEGEGLQRARPRAACASGSALGRQAIDTHGHPLCTSSHVGAGEGSTDIAQVAHEFYGQLLEFPYTQQGDSVGGICEIGKLLPTGFRAAHLSK